MSPGNSDGAYIFLDAAYIQRGLSKRPVQVTLAPLGSAISLTIAEDKLIVSVCLFEQSFIRIWN
jgi:hypothetical protein